MQAYTQLLTISIFLITYGLIVFRNLFSFPLPIWAIFLASATAMVFSGAIGVSEAYSAINMRVIVFLFSMFSLVTALEISGALELFANRILRSARSPRTAIFLLFVGFAAASSVLMNDTMALMGAPIAISIARKMRISTRLMLLVISFAVTIGSVPTPMGNPQNLLIAIISNIRAPVISFAHYLILPTVINIFATYLLLILFFRKELKNSNYGSIKQELMDGREVIVDAKLANYSYICLISTISLIVVVDTFESAGISLPIGISEVSLLGATALLVGSGKAREILRSIDWGILVLFSAMFVIMQAVSDNGVISYLSSYLPPLNKAEPAASILSILISSVLLSQVLSNVPMVALYMPLMHNLGYGPRDVYAWVALAGGSTLAGNLTILGAASNLIVIEEAERRGEKLTFIDFFKIGLPVTIVNVAVLYFFLLAI